MSLTLVWYVECCDCKKTHTEEAVPLDMICDSDPVRVKQPKLKDWETDGLGGWMCKTCFQNHQWETR